MANAKTEVAGTSFLSMIDYMRDIILQDAVLLLEIPEYRDHPVAT
jgi:hypothetical protein